MTNRLNLFIKIAPSQLPQNIRTFLAANYRNSKIVYIDKIKDEYEIKLSNGIYINFDKNGSWNYISSDDKLSENILPKTIASKIKNIMKKYNNAYIFEINKRIEFYRVRLTNSLEIRIKNNGQLIMA
ncbi:PepSY-like domain-containing protein [Brachyspira hyodysenteriae]|uniref:PepSY-like domain-containing protein n=2 Tax=Brachyspira hyodysenteriae TaxID=159 RepID=UPI001ADDBA60|nr:PepSY-like domain-containing protein [Brachyspira hyodysenteriae]MBT8720089.1 PepSY-like domain-containing protein [Brachyspira hyodysenteriae]MBT8730327.1 PepSY-like domain-containing protein [Brachyspira hyodysenteriae]MBT8732824.1 PepSY-like domain-containing protein [Brachyspira hyodysenteriae]MBT8735432.1 PepSY-like domain-containing protein [Brachyspira hyodysenteriae]MBT8738222.1 PepSY-like domain-containing protein [Brachyspira hyodysenteriae]